jgi:hypothetical protein
MVIEAGGMNKENAEREGQGRGGEMTQTLCVHMNKRNKNFKKRENAEQTRITNICAHKTDHTLRDSPLCFCVPGMKLTWEFSQR